MSNSDHLIKGLGGAKEIKEYSNQIREYRNSLIHGRKYKHKKHIEFKELVLFDKINYYLIVRRVSSDEKKIDDFITTIFFAFQHNIIK